MGSIVSYLPSSPQTNSSTRSIQEPPGPALVSPPVPGSNPAGERAGPDRSAKAVRPRTFRARAKKRIDCGCATGGSDAMDPQQEAVLKKIAWRIVPLLTLAYVVNYLDRTNIGFAALTMNKELGFTRDRVRHRRRRPVHRLHRVRGPEQPRALPVRRAALDRAHHDHLGHRVGADRAGRRRQVLLPRAVRARRRRSRVLPRRRLLFRGVVSDPIPHPHAGLVPRRHPAVLGDRRPDLRPAPGARRRARPQGLAVAVHRRGHPGGRSRLRGAARAGGPAGRRRMADAEGARHPQGDARRGTARAAEIEPRSLRSPTPASSSWPWCSSASRSAPTGSASSCRRSSRPAGSPISR